MTFLLILAFIVALTLGAALTVSIIEGSSGYLGDSSMVPAVLVVGLVALVIAVTAGFVNGNIGVWIK
jgi:hypothetical protein